MKKIITLIVFCISSVYAGAQFVPNYYTNLQKYWWYRYTLVNDYMKIGEGCGESIPAIRHLDAGDFDSADAEIKVITPHLHFTDATIYLGNYFLVLGTEWRILHNTHLSTARTEYELYYALKAFDRLDLVAEERCRDFAATQDCNNISPHGNDLNGFFIRDDANESFEANNHSHFNRQYVCNPISGTNGDVIGRQDNMMEPDWSVQHPTVPRYPVEMSQDQVASLYIGLAMVIQELDWNVQYNGVNLKDMAQNAIYRMVAHCSLPGPGAWTIVNPVTGKLVYGVYTPNSYEYFWQNYVLNSGAGIFPCSPAMPAGLLRTNAVWNTFLFNNINGLQTTTAGNIPVYQLLKNSLFKGIKGNQNLFITSFTAVGKEWRNMVLGGANVSKDAVRTQSAHDKFRWPHLPLIYNLINGGGVFKPQDWPWKQKAYQDMLTEAPKCLMFNKYGVFSENNWEWSSPNRLAEAFKRGNTAHVNADFPGLSYMALFNLYQLNEPGYGNEVGGISNRYYVENFNHNFYYATPFMNKYTYRTLEYLSTSSTIFPQVDVVFRNAKVIDLLPGFNAQYGSAFETVIKDYTCSNCNQEEGEFLMQVENDDFTMDTLFTSIMEPVEIPDEDEEQYSPTPEEMTEDSLYWVQQIYNSGDSNAIAYLEYLETLEEGSDLYRLATTESINIAPIQPNIFVFPNPSSGVFNIKTTSDNYSVTIYDAIGKLIYKKIGLSGNSNLNLGGNAKGFYLLNISSKTGGVIKSFKLTLE